MTHPLAALGWVTDHLETWLAKSWLIATLVAGLAALGVAIDDQTPWILAIVVLAFVATAGLSRTLDGEDGAIALGLFGWALAFRLLIVLVLSLVSSGYVTGGLLSPDGAGYLSGSRVLLRSGFDVGSPFAFFGTYDLGEYYVFAALMGLGGSDFVLLTAFNAAISALAAPFAFGWARLTIPRHAVLVGGIAALSPSLAFLSTTNLLKDPMIIFVTVVVALSVAEVLRGEANGVALWAWLGICAIGLAFLHTTRFYVAAYLELGLIIVIALRLVAARGRSPLSSRLLALGGAILAAELMAGALGWPSSPVLVSSQVQYVADTRAMQPVLEQNAVGDRVPGVATVVDVGHRLLGPYAWVTPSTFDLRYLILADFDLYPDTFLWYVILPFLVVGLAIALFSLAARREGSAALGCLAIFVCIYLAQYLAINLSYRQREDVVLLALAFVPAGAQWVLSRRPGRALYATYWVVIVILALGQVIRSNV